jgi:hypothetical protein
VLEIAEEDEPLVDEDKWGAEGKSYRNLKTRM